MSQTLNLTEFFMLLLTRSLAYRRRELAWVNGDQMGVNFLLPGRKKKSRAPSRKKTSCNSARR
jgi:hypothetical protein